ncbi:YgaP family membrane protein [Pannonibacter phragmitetus]|uniref:YgaP family membrane protein n=1 Tax=Pannonibacter phragmitetus TaxID=121719 RepID=UPI000B97C211|nr:DUF2892 domain-containing protein [Pannonibacter phragmitetus]
MTFNVGTPDRIIRVIVGLLLIAAPFITGWAMFTNPAWTWGAVLVGLIMIVTGAVRFCPAYRLFRLDTSKGARR